MMRKNYSLLFLLLIVSSFLGAQSLKRAVPAKETIQAIPDYCSDQQLIIKLAETAQFNRFDYELLHDDLLLREFKNIVGNDLTMSRRIPIAKETLLDYKAKGEASSGIQLGNLSSYYQIDLQGKTTGEKISIYNLLTRMEELECVYFPVDYSDWNLPAYDFQQEASALSITPDLTSGQFYLDPPPDGLDAKYAWTKGGSKGNGIQFCDMELGYYANHEDLVGAGIQNIGTGNVTEDHHGTAVAGVVFAQHNGFGVDGFAPFVTPFFISARDSTGDWNMALSISTTMTYFNPGDVMLLEMMDQSNTSNSKYAPVEFSQAEFDAIQTMTANGMIVVEAAGNGNKNLDDQTKYQQKFDSTYRYSGAFIIGGVKSGKSGGESPQHQRRHPSSYGSRVDFFAYSEKVTTTGYGDLYGSTNDEKYTEDFFGTSSASPIIAGACVVMESIYKTATGGQTLDHATLKNLLYYGSTNSYDPANDKVGVMPDLKDAVDYMLLTIDVEQNQKEGWSMHVFPQPVTDRLTILLNTEASTGTLQVFDLLGNLIESENIVLNQGLTTLNKDLSSYAKGVYFVKAQVANQELVQKIVKQ